MTATLLSPPRLTLRPNLRTMYRQLIFTVGIGLGLSQLSFADNSLSVTVLEERPHDSSAFTQGLLINEGKVYESSGLYGKSFIRRYDNQSQKIEKQRKLPNKFFAEGLTLLNKQLFLLTWKAGMALVLDPKTLQPLKKFTYSGEGWGLTHSSNELIMSDGSDRLTFRDPSTFKKTNSILVHSKRKRYKHLNELEYAESAIWANVWQSNFILKISPRDGSVIGIADLSKLTVKNNQIKSESVLNGIAYDHEKKAFWITGKYWPTRYLVTFE